MTPVVKKGLGLVIVGACVIVAGVMGLFVYMAATAKPLHPNPQEIPSSKQLAAAPKWTDAVERARQSVRAVIAEQNLPGVSVAVGAGGEIVWAEGFGWANIEHRVPVTPDTRFRIGTASKVLTSAAVGWLMEKGRLNLDDEIHGYVPAFPKKQWPVTLRQVMAHVAGITRDAGDEEPVGVQEGQPPAPRCQQTADRLERFADRPLLFEPGTEYRYSNYGWILVSAAVEAAAAEPFSRFMRRQIFEPLGMKHTSAESPLEPSPDRATFYFPRFSADPRYGPDEGREVDYSCFAGSAAFVSTPSELVRFGIAMQSGSLLQPATVQTLQESQRLTSGDAVGYGLGWDIETATLAGASTRQLGHDGDMLGGMVASFMIFPHHGLIVAVTSNIGFADTPAIGLKIAEAFAR